MISNLLIFIKSSKGLAIIALGLWSTQAVFLAYGLNKNEISTILFPSFLIAAIFIILFRIFHTKVRKYSELQEYFPTRYITLLIGSFLMLSYHWFLFYGLQIGPKVETNLMNFLWPLFLFVLAKLIFKKERLFNRLKNFLGNGSFADFEDVKETNGEYLFKILLAIVGIIVMITQFNSFNFIKWQGPMFGFFAALCWAMLSILLRFQDTVNYISSFIVVTAILAFGYWYLEGRPSFFNTKLLLISIYFGVGPFGFAMLCWEYAMKKNCVNEIAALGFLAPLFSTILLFFFGFESISKWSLIGFALVLYAVITKNGWKIIRVYLQKITTTKSLNKTVNQTLTNE